MANLETKTKYINIVVRKLDIIHISERNNFILQWCNSECEHYAYIYHKEDINPITGETESEHLHLVATLRTSKRLSTTLTSFRTAVGLTSTGVMIDKINSYEGSIQYLIHKNDKQKTRHEVNEIITNYTPEELDTYLKTDIQSLTAERLFGIVINANTNYEIIRSIGLNQYRLLRPIIKDIQQDIYERKKRFKDIVS